MVTAVPLLPPQRQMYQYLNTIMTEFGRLSVAVSSQCPMFLFHSVSLVLQMPLTLLPPTQNFLQDECIVQLYLRPINAFLGITSGEVISTYDFSNSDSEC